MKMRVNVKLLKFTLVWAALCFTYASPHCMEKKAAEALNRGQSWSVFPWEMKPHYLSSSYGQSRSKILKGAQMYDPSVFIESLQWTLRGCQCGFVYSPMANKWLICVHAGNTRCSFPPNISPAHCIKLSFSESRWMSGKPLYYQRARRQGLKSMLQKALKINKI